MPSISVISSTHAWLAAFLAAAAGVEAKHKAIFDEAANCIAKNLSPTQAMGEAVTDIFFWLRDDTDTFLNALSSMCKEANVPETSVKQFKQLAASIKLLGNDSHVKEVDITYQKANMVVRFEVSEKPKKPLAVSAPAA